ncbi:hypothetical protein NBRC116583_10640 [Arenicella sp. 4NH20-0111]|uniref:hypothetical protein n=1 Tax=Arenicella sp. 4NH20-0111 TaxID=3127648 RepID=UPI0031082186
MSNEVKQSLEENLDVILENLPEEFHQDLKKSIESAAPQPILSPEQARVEAAQLMKEDPAIDDKSCVPLLEEDPTIASSISQPSAEELEAQKSESLKLIQQELSEAETEGE